ncbi:hypothetical protein Psta_2241 [Pirellula staleyi DSM 6068]|uniref:Uncharacterized protein n=1 Tax=Pirellula staleyi (strain ATCC 27377 / DSM 6068 / ICPB 4128) TaxID=530564 RepID=D2R2S2_PIRSD|nr:hypothetical protein [Pirellula staleyi]ADB16912.1 hypothetical protein Psta_2241 [Pirellula staleyi DSM 6068]
MSEVEAAQMLQEMIDKHFRQTLECAKKVIALSARSANESDRRDTYIALAKATTDYLSFLPESQKPSWLKQIDLAVKRAANEIHSQDRCYGLAETIAENYHKITRIQLRMPSDTKVFNFDEIFAELKRKHNLTEVFDRLAEEMLQILATNEIDSVTITDVLNEIIAVLKANRDGSPVAMKGSVSTARFGWNIAYEFLKTYVPGVQPIADGIDRTLNECEEKLEQIENGFNSQVTIALLDSVKSLASMQAKMAKDVEYLADCMKNGKILVIEGRCSSVPGVLQQQLGNVLGIDYSQSESSDSKELGKS